MADCMATEQTMMTEWRKVALGDVCTKIGSGATPRGGKEVYLEDGPYALIRSQNVYNAGFAHDGLAFISDEHAESLNNVEVLPDDVLLNITGDSVARVCQVDTAVLPARVNQHVAIIRPDSNKLDATYLRYYLASPEIQAILLSWAGSGGTRNALTKQPSHAQDRPHHRPICTPPTVRRDGGHATPTVRRSIYPSVSQRSQPIPAHHLPTALSAPGRSPLRTNHVGTAGG